MHGPRLLGRFSSLFSVFIAWFGLTVDTLASVYGLFGLQFSRFLREGDSVAELPEESRKVWLHCETVFGKCFFSASLARRWMPVCVSLAPNFAHFLREGGRGNQDFLRAPCLWLFCSVSSPEEKKKNLKFLAVPLRFWTLFPRAPRIRWPLAWCLGRLRSTRSFCSCWEMASGKSSVFCLV